ncbi:MAG: PASTA domain-containing protein [Lachnospiraceae bacterium]|nr:PASTA domain-containing protein [Lachnospiraceae bacterium]
MADKICMGCMEHYNDKYDICPRCGYVDGTGPREAYHLSPGTILQGKYIVGKVIGFGGFGVTYIGYNAILDKKIAIKEYLPGEFATRAGGSTEVTVFSGEREEQFASGIVKFVDEAKRLARFKHTPGIVSVYDSFQENKTAYIIMEYLEGENLATKIDREGKLPLDEAFNIMMPVVGALKEVHKEGILHRDISPDNIFITNSGEVKLLDFGAARYATTTHSKSLSVIVKPGYAPQEQYRSRGDQGTWTDVYACAATLYKMITGVTPEDSMERGNKDTLVPPSKLGIKIPKNKENAIMNALNLRIEDRTPTADAFEADLSTDEDVKRNKIKLKKMDIGRWPLWLKITTGTAATAIATLAILLITGVISFGSLNIFDKGGLDDGTVYVPNVVNYSLPEAEKKTDDAQLITQIVDKKNSDVIPKDMVLSQNIQDGEVVQIGTVLEITVSAGGELVYIPDLVGMTKEEAVATLEKLGLYYQVEEEKSEVAENHISKQGVAEGTAVEKGETIIITVSTGIDDIDEDEETKVPALVGKKWEDAVSLVSSSNLYIFKSGSEYSTKYPKGQIISQSLAAGTNVKQGTSIGVVVSLGIEKTRVPDVQFKSRTEAERLMASANLIISVQYEDSKTVAKDHVIRQSIEAGTEVDMQTTVTVWISRGNPAAENAPTTESTRTTEDVPDNTEPTVTTTVAEGTDKDDDIVIDNDDTPVVQPPQPEPDDGNIEVPNLVGMTESQAKSALTDKKLKVGVVSYQHDETKTDGTVLSQGVAAGTKVGKNSEINIVVCNNEQYVEYRYRTKTTKTVTNQTLNEGTLVDSQESWSDWSGESTNPVTEDEYTDVETRTETSYLDNPGAPLPVPTRKYSSEVVSYNAEIHWVQRFLNSYYGPILVEDGKYGGLGMYYVGVFQGEQGLGVDKSIGPNTTARMLQIWRERTATTTTYYKYRTKTVTNTYEIWSGWSEWSTTAVTETTDNEVETRNVYKY